MFRGQEQIGHGSRLKLRAVVAGKLAAAAIHHHDTPIHIGEYDAVGRGLEQRAVHLLALAEGAIRLCQLGGAPAYPALELLVRRPETLPRLALLNRRAEYSG